MFSNVDRSTGRRLAVRVRRRRCRRCHEVDTISTRIVASDLSGDCESTLFDWTVSHES